MTIILVWVTAHCFPVRHSLLCSTRMFLLLNAQKRDKIPNFLSVTILVKTTEHYFSLVLFIVLYKVILIFESCG